jgi:hypothetical protein
MKTITGSDGARAEGSWHDAQLGVDCYFSQASDGVIRCVPSDLAYLGFYYADAACSTPLAYAGCTSPSFAASYQACSSAGTTYYSIGGAYTGAAYVLGGTTCSAAESSGITLYSVASPFPVSGFAPATLSE